MIIINVYFSVKVSALFTNFIVPLWPRIRLSFSEFELEAGGGSLEPGACGFDFLEIREESMEGPLVGR